MGKLHLENVPDELVREIERLAESERQTPAAKAVSLLQEAVFRTQSKAVAPEQPEARRTVQAILNDLARNRFRTDPEGPNVVEMLREDRNR